MTAIVHFGLQPVSRIPHRYRGVQSAEIGQNRPFTKAFMFPDFWVSFLNQNDLHGAVVELPEEFDLSGLGVDLQFLTAEQSMDEATNFWPGLGVAKDGYVPIGSCLIGSGDYYYIRSHDGQAGPLYRIYHDAVDDDGYEPDDAIAVVLQSYKNLLGFVRKEQM